jgi:hypothetical protein
MAIKDNLPGQVDIVRHTFALIFRYFCIKKEVERNMKTLGSLLSTVLFFSLVSFGQGNEKVQAKSHAQAAAEAAANVDKNVMAATSAQVSGKLEKTLDISRAKVGDQVLLKTTQAVKQNGHTVIDKGSLLVGRVTEVQKKTQANASSSISIVFDKIISGGKEMPISGIVTSVVSSSASTAAAADSDVFAASSARGSRSNGSGGGLISSAGNAVGGIINTTTQTVGSVGSVVDTSIGSTVNGTVGVAGSSSTSIAGLSISSSTDASANANSTLTMNGKNLRLDKGTVFFLNIKSSGELRKN